MQTGYFPISRHGFPMKPLLIRINLNSKQVLHFFAAMFITLFHLNSYCQIRNFPDFALTILYEPTKMYQPLRAVRFTHTQHRFLI